MANIDGSLIFNALMNLDGFQQGLQQANEQVNSLSGTAQTALGNLAANAARDIANAVTGAFKTASEFIVSTGSSFESSMSQVAATMAIDTASEDYAMLAQAAKDMGAATKFSATEAGEALNYLALAGNNAEDSVTALPTILNIAAAGGMELAAASDMVTDSMSALGLEMDDLTSFSDKLAKTSQKSNTSVAQLGQAILTVGGTAKMLTGGVDEMNTVLGILADNGIKGAEGGTALRNIITDIGGKTKPAQEALQKLAVSAYDVDGNMRPLKDTFYDLNEALSHVTDQERTKLLTDIFGAMDLKAVNALLGTTSERFDELAGYLADCDGAAQQMADTMNDNLQGDLTILNSSLEAVGVSAFEKFSQPMRTAVQDVTGIVGQLNDALSGELGSKLETVAEKLGELAVKAAEFAVDEGLPKLIDGLEWICDHSEELMTAADVAAALVIAYKGFSAISTVTTAIEGAAAAAGGLNAALAAGAAGPWIAIGAAAIALGVALRDIIEAERELIGYESEVKTAYDNTNKSIVYRTNSLNEMSDSGNSAERKQAYDEAVNDIEEYADALDNNTERIKGLKISLEHISAIDEPVLFKNIEDEIAGLEEQNVLLENAITNRKTIISDYENWLDNNHSLFVASDYTPDQSEWYRQQNKKNAGKTTADVITEIQTGKTASQQYSAEEMDKLLSDGWAELEHKRKIGVIKSDEELYRQRLELLDKYGDESNEKHWKYYEQIADYEQKRNNSNEDPLQKEWAKLDHDYAMGVIRSDEELYEKRLELLDKYGDESNEKHWRFYEQAASQKKKFDETDENTETLKEKWEQLDHDYAVGIIKDDKELYAKRMELLKEYGDESNKEHWRFYEQAAGQKKKFDDEEIKEEQKHSEDLKKEQEKRNKEIKKGLENDLDDINKVYQKNYNDLIKQQENYRKRLMSVGGDIFTITTEKDKDGNETKTYKINDVKKQIEEMRKYHADIKKLKDEGAGDLFLSEINSLSPEDGKAMAKYIAGLSDADRKQIYDLYAEKQAVADELSADLYKKDAENMQNAFAAAISDMGINAYDSGAAAGEQFANGFNGKLSELIDTSAYANAFQFKENAAAYISGLFTPQGGENRDVNVDTKVTVSGGNIVLDGIKLGKYVLDYITRSDVKKG